MGPIEGVKPRDVAKNNWAGIRDSEEARRVLEALETKGWVALVEFSNKRPGPKNVIYFLHPAPTDKSDKI